MASHEIEDAIMAACSVPPEHQAVTRGSLVRALESFTEEVQRKCDLQRPKADLARVAKLSNELSDAIDQLERKLDRSAPWFWNKAAGLDTDGADRNFDLHEMRDRLAALIASCNRIARPQPEKPAHRPRGVYKYPELRRLILKLYGIIAGMGGGKLTLSQNRDWSPAGTLPEVLEILRPSLPAGAIPKSLPYSTLSRTMHTARRRLILAKSRPIPLNQKLAR
jgi:hypothetical protein